MIRELLMLETSYLKRVRAGFHAELIKQATNGAKSGKIAEKSLAREGATMSGLLFLYAYSI